MANQNNGNGSETLAKGIRLTVIVEHSFENVIAVLLYHNGKEYRGVLLENNTGFFPPGLPFNKPMLEQTTSVKMSPRSALDVKPGTENKPPDVTFSKDFKLEQPASCCRFSYNTNPFLVNPRPEPDVPTVEMKLLGPRKKMVRDIRLRPRQTLCSKCKSAIHDNLKTQTTSGAHTGMLTRGTRKILASSKAPVKLYADSVKSRTVSRTISEPYSRKRKGSDHSPMVLLEDIKLKYMKTNERRSSRAAVAKHIGCKNSTDLVNAESLSKGQQFEGRAINCKAKYLRSASENTSDLCQIESGHDFLQEIEDSSTSKLLKKEKNGTVIANKPSPTIKISIGDKAVLKIPPRLPENESQPIGEQKWPAVEDNGEVTENQMYHKKSKKAAKKSKEKDEFITSKPEEKSATVSVNEHKPLSLKIQKKHKKKHRHKHNEMDLLNLSHENHILPQKTEEVLSDLPSEPSLCLHSEKGNDKQCNIVNDYLVEENAMVEKPRPRLLYTWKQNQGLSRVASSPKQTPADLSPSHIFRNSPSNLTVSNSPHRRKNASPARVISASPNWPMASPHNVILKDYPLRSRSLSGHSSTGLTSENSAVQEYGVGQASEDSQSHSSGVDSNVSDFSDDEYGEELDCEEEFFFREGSPELGKDSHSTDGDGESTTKPLMMKIQTQNVSGCVLEEGREVRVGDIVWGKIPGFPWWPGRVANITVTQRDNDVVITQLAKVCWFGSNTMSHVHCADLFPFLQDFKARYNKKKKGQYRVAIKQATLAAQMLSATENDDFSYEGYK